MRHKKLSTASFHDIIKPIEIFMTLLALERDNRQSFAIFCRTEVVGKKSFINDPLSNFVYCTTNAF